MLVGFSFRVRVGPEEHGLAEALQWLVLRDDFEIVSVFRVDLPEHQGELGPHPALLVQGLEREPGAEISQKVVAFC